MALTILVVLLSLMNFLLGTSALLRNSRINVNRRFAVFAFTTSAWMVANYIGANFKNYHYAQYFVRTDFFLGPWMVYALWSFMSSFIIQARPKFAKLQKLFGQILFTIITFTSIISFTSLVVTIGSDGNQNISINYGPLFNLYGATLLGGIFFVLGNTINAYAHSNGRLRQQIGAMLTGLSILTVFFVIPNLIVPLITDSTSINLTAGNLAYFGMFIFVGVSFYGIVKHRLFDIRLTIIRSIGFVFTVGIVALVYTIIVLGIGALFIANDQNGPLHSSAQLAILIPATIFVALTFHTIQAFIARLTRHVFYQETYDLKMVLDAISDTLITDNDIEKIMSQSLHVITDAIRPSYAFLAVFDNEDRIYRTLNVDISFDEQTVIQLLAYSKTTKDNPIMRDDFLEKKLPEYFTTNDLSLVVRLGERDNPVGLLLFGVKQNGRTYTGDDIALLRISSTNIGIALDNAKKYEQISHFAETMHEEVLKATAKLRNANEKLKTLDALKDDFISMASHQLRTPAASVHEALQMLNHPMMPLSKTDRARLEELAEASSEHLVTVVSDMLSIARIQSGHFTVNKSPTILQNLVEKVLKQTSVLAEQKDIKIEQKLPSEPISVHVDVAKMNEAFSNYIENAIKYSPEKTTVTISLQTDKNKVKFEIEDMGMGVPEDERDGLFTKFYRAKNARNEQPDGNGIGLFVVKSIANGHDGDVYYEPLPSGGSKFGFWIPVK